MLERATYNCAGIELTMGKHWNWVPSLREMSMTAGQLTQTQSDPAFPSLNSIAPITLRSVSLDSTSPIPSRARWNIDTCSRRALAGESGTRRGRPHCWNCLTSGPGRTTRMQMPYGSGRGP